jgi:hypothetical protein
MIGCLEIIEHTKWLFLVKCNNFHEIVIALEYMNNEYTKSRLELQKKTQIFFKLALSFHGVDSSCKAGLTFH